MWVSVPIGLQNDPIAWNDSAPMTARGRTGVHPDWFLDDRIDRHGIVCAKTDIFEDQRDHTCHSQCGHGRDESRFWLDAYFPHPVRNSVLLCARI